MAEIDLKQDEWAQKINDLWHEGVDKADQIKLYTELAPTYDQVYPHDARSQYQGAVQICEKAAVCMAHLKNLTEAGFQNFDPIDGCAEMLEVAKTKGVYKNIMQRVIAADCLPIEDSTYSGLLLAEALLLGYIGVECFPERIRITRTGGMMVFATGNDPRFVPVIRNEIQALEKKGLWKLIEDNIIENHWGDLQGVIIVFEVTKQLPMTCIGGKLKN